jgi:Raf kinase inhibitor-like YbhB/YbcL family protein
MCLRIYIKLISLSLLLALIVSAGCERNDNTNDQVVDFILSSPEIKADSLLPMDFTCDGSSASLPLEWSGEPAGTVSYAVIMHHVASPTDVHWYWVFYNIPSSVHSIPRNVSGIGTLGTNSVNGRNAYAPPCSQGPGLKSYTITVYALSANPVISSSDVKVTRDVLLAAIKDITLASSKIRVSYARAL